MLWSDHGMSPSLGSPVGVGDGPVSLSVLERSDGTVDVLSGGFHNNRVCVTRFGETNSLIGQGCVELQNCSGAAHCTYVGDARAFCTCHNDNRFTEITLPDVLQPD